MTIPSVKKLVAVIFLTIGLLGAVVARADVDCSTQDIQEIRNKLDDEIYLIKTLRTDLASITSESQICLTVRYLLESLKRQREYANAAIQHATHCGNVSPGIIDIFRYVYDSNEMQIQRQTNYFNEHCSS